MSEAFHKLSITTLVVVPLLGALTAVVLLWNRHVFPGDMVLLLVFYLCTGLGVALGYHRMLTHRSFETSGAVRGLLLILGCMAFEGSPSGWAATHIKHHAHSDKEGDPHSPLEGFWHAHFGWLFSSRNFSDAREYVPHLLEDPVVRFVDRSALLWMGLSLGLPAVLGGWTGFVWGGLVRIFILNHMTWSVNSVCHTFGRRPFEAGDESRNEWIVGLLGFGEGWHNNHHAFPQNAFHGMRWWQFDLSGSIVRILETLGLVWNVQRVSPELMEAKARKAESIRRLLLERRTRLGASIADFKEELAALLDGAKGRISIRGQASLFGGDEEERMYRMEEAYEDARKRLGKIQKQLLRRKTLRRERIEEYKREARELVARAKEKMGRLQPMGT